MQHQRLIRARLITGVLIIAGIVLASFLAIYSSPTWAQGLSVQSRSDPSVIGAGMFISLEGRFSLALPQQPHGFRGLKLVTPLGPATGDSYQWSMKEGSFTAIYADATQPLDDPETSKRVFDDVYDKSEKFATSQNGKVVSYKPIKLDKHSGVELRLELSTGFMIQRVYLSARRMYLTALVVKHEQRVYEAVALGVLDSFKILNEAEVATVLKEQIASAELSPLPQEPMAPRIGSDADDEGLHGRVKTVFAESQDLSGTWSIQTRKPNSMAYYNEHGNLTKQELYDYKGNLSDINVYGYLDGARASRRASIRHEYNPPPVMIGPPAGDVKPKYDPRYSNKFAFTYDDKRRLIEKTWIGNDGKLWLRYVYKYSGARKEELVYSADGSLNQRYLSTLDERGNKIEETIFETRDGSVRSKHSYAYEFDSNGNWTKRTGTKWVTKDGSLHYEPQSVYYRTITYYK